MKYKVVSKEVETYKDLDIEKDIVLKDQITC